MDNKFTVEKLIKGRIAETVFEEMFKEAGNYSIIPFGYERLVPELADHKKFPSAQKVLDNIRTSPDYAVIMPDKKSIFLVEVKFRKNIDIDNVNYIIEVAQNQQKRWNPSWIFLATLEGFYFAECSNIIKYNCIQRLEEKYVPKNLQDKYLNLIKEFEK